MEYWTYGAVLIGMIVTVAGATSQDHPFTVKDDIAMARFTEPFPRSGVPRSDIAPRSPDGRYFAVITTKGLLKSDQLESQISIFSRDTVRALVESKVASGRPAPRVVATIVGSTYYEASHPYASVITDLRWSADMTRIYFKGENSVGAYQLYVAKIDGSGFHALTPANYSVDRYDIENHTIVYTASLSGIRLVDRGIPINRDAWMVTGYSLVDNLFPGELGTFGPEAFSLWTMKKSHGEWMSTQVANASFRDERYFSFLSPFKLSPKGDKLIELTPATKVPTSWQSYNPAAGFEHLRLSRADPRLTRDGNMWKPQQYSLIDLVRGKLIPLVGAPNARTLAYLDNSDVVWAADESRVLVTNTFLPLDRTASVRPEHTSPCAVASVDIPSLDVRCLKFNTSQTTSQQVVDHVLDVAFGTDKNEVFVLSDLRSGVREEEKYRVEDSEWKLISSTPVSSKLGTLAAATGSHDVDADDIQLFVKQSLNDSPTLWVREVRTGRETHLWDPNPQFAHIQFANVSVYRWKDKTGREWTGGLVKPVGYMPGQRYPLVIQMYMFYDGQFMTDGTDPSAFAARELASAGFMVLQIQKKPDTLTDADPEVHLEGYRSAIEHLSDAGLIDSSRVGAVGFSWTCWYVEYALINAPHLFVAATIADGLDNSYMGYHLFAEGDTGLQGQMEKIHGANPFGEGLKTWVAMAPSFHLDKVQTPLRIEAINPVSLLGEWEIYSSLRMQNKPVDLIYFPHGTHIHQKPLERLESQQGDVDWLRFWLQRYEDPDPTKASQYVRWRELRKLQDQSTPLRKTVPEN